MNYCFLDDCKSEYKPQGIHLVKYYNENIEEIAELLEVERSHIPRGISISVVEGDGARYSKADRKIEYRYKCGDDILNDKGKLIHEAAHIVQDYPEGINRDHPCWCWMEGIADYCRAQIDEEFKIEENLKGSPLDGYKETAHFLSWLSKKYETIVPKLNARIHNDAHNIISDSYIFSNLTDELLPALLKEYHEENKDKFIKTTLAGREKNT